MSVLPLNWPDKVDSPELLAWLQQFGLEKYIDSNQINSIRDALNELHERTQLKNYHVIASSVNDSDPVTGTTAIVNVYTQEIDGNTVIVGDRLILRVRIIKVGENGVVSHRHSIGNIGFFAQTSANNQKFHQIERLFVVKSSTITEEISGTVNVNSSNGGYLANQRVNINWALPQTIKIGLNNNHPSDSSFVSYWELIRIRG